MPYEIFKVKGGYKIGKKDGTLMSNGRMYASNRPLNLVQAKKQLAALYAQENPATFRTFEFPEGYKVGRKDKRKMDNNRFYSTNRFLTKEEARAELKRVNEKYNNKNN